MTRPTHQLIGLTAATLTFFAVFPDTPLTWPLVYTVITGAFFGSLLPDVDQASSTFWDSIPLGSLGGAIVPNTLGGHRNLSHSLLGLVLFYGLSSLVVEYLVSNNINHGVLLLALVSGFVAHLLSDAITMQGIPIFWPFGRNMGFPPRPFHGARMVTGKWFEHLVVLPLAFLALGYTILAYQERFCDLIRWLCR